MKKIIIGKRNKLNLIFTFFLSFFYLQYSNSNIMIFSIPKSGTHLIAKCIELLTNKKLANELNYIKVIKYGLPNESDNEFFRCHMPFKKNINKKLKQLNYKTFFIYRDPRDQIVSRAYWLQERFKIYYNEKIELNENFNFPKSVKFLLQKIKQGIFPNHSLIIDILIDDINRCYYKYLKWLTSKNICCIKFENLVGSHGGGSDFLQEKEINKICDFLNIKDKSLIDNSKKNIFGDTFTFRKGEIGSWKKEFTIQQKQKFNQVASNLLLELGYEQ